MKKIIYTIFIAIYGINLSGQSIPDGYPSPEATSLGIVETVPVNHYNGKINLTIPLMNLKVNNHNLPIYLSYNSSGFMPNVMGGWVGHNWTLNVGGVITRIVKGKPDETQNYGIYHSHSALNNALEGKITQDLPNYDTEPDEFHFNVNGISGKFYLNENQQFTVASETGIKVEYSSMESVSFPANGTDRTFREFMITDRDGNLYIFAPDDGLIETSLADVHSKAVATAWYLYEIRYKDTMETVRFNYTEKKTDYTYSYSESYQYDPTVSNCNGYSQKAITTTLQHIYLQSIETSTFKATFNTSDINYNNYPVTKHSQNWQKLDNIILESKATNKEIEKVELSYADMTNSTRLFLETVQKKGEPAYKLTYHQMNTAKIIKFDSKDIDHWGYYNDYSKVAYGEMDKNKLLVSEFFIMKDEISGITYYPNRETNPEMFNIGMLKSIQYPTGAYSEFTYEPHEYSYYMAQRMHSAPYLNYVPEENKKRAGTWQVQWYNDYGKELNQVLFTDDSPTMAFIYVRAEGSGASALTPVTMTMRFPGKNNEYTRRYFIEQAGFPLPADGRYYVIQITSMQIEDSEVSYTGGARIKRIKQKDGDTELIKEYTYTKGILSGIPSYKASKLSSDPKGQTIQKAQMQSNSITPSDLANGMHIGYTEIKETYKDKNNNQLGYTIYTYTNFDTCPDGKVKIYDLDNIPDDIGVRNSMDYKRGKLTKKRVYSSAGKLVQQTTTNYIHVERADKLVGFFFRSGNIFSSCLPFSTSYFPAAYDILKNSYLPEKETTIMYDPEGNNPITTTVDYTYNKYDQLSTTQMTNSDNKVIKTEYTYLGDEPSKVSVSGNINSLIEKKVYNSDNLVTKEVWEYDKDFLIAYYTQHMGNNELEKRIEYHEYDSFGNPLGVTKDDSQQVVMIWSYGGQYPVARIENVSYQEVETILGRDLLTAEIPMMITVDKSNINAARELLQQGFPNAFITTYTHDPLVGVTSTTDPRGVTTYFEYDDYNRLKSSYYLENGVKRILEAYEYNYRE